MTRAFAAAAADMLLDHGPLTLEELHALAVERGLTKSKTPSTLRCSLDSGDYVLRPDGRYDTAQRLLRGQVFTTRPRPGERDGVLWTYRDLDALAALRRMPLGSGGELRRGQGAIESWTGPKGWLPTTSAGELLALRWDGAALHVSVVDDVPAGDSDVVRDVREVLGRHARGQRRYGLSSEPRASLTGTVLSALVEDPALFSRPLPPLRELLPLPESLRPSDGEPGRDPELRARIVEVPVPLRVHDELARRADLIGERLPDYLALLLGAAADRVQLTPYTYDRYEPYGGPFTAEGGDVVRLDSWGR
ncbi:MAG TPA: hypothetical protein VNU26_16885 [Mycobacteriales bacterium]|nr:hypothetical protein [Mycobacteriales bacterium]